MSVLAMMREGLPASDSDDDARPFGASVEKRLMADYFGPAGAPEDRPYYVPFGPDAGKSRWRNSSYAGSSLQRQRQDRGDQPRFQERPERPDEAVARHRLACEARGHHDLEGSVLLAAQSRPLDHRFVFRLPMRRRRTDLA